MLLSSACIWLRDEKLAADRGARIARKPLLCHARPERGEYSVRLGDIVAMRYEEKPGEHE